MTYSLDALSNRTMSAYPISIGSSFFLEAIAKGPGPTYDLARALPPMVNIVKYDEVWINLFTLFRNIISSLDKNGFNRVMPGDLCDVLQFEVDLIRQVIDEVSFGKTKAVFYASDYAGLERKYKFARVRVDSTDRQKIYTSLLTSTVSEFFKNQVKSEHMLHFSLKLKPTVKKKVVIVTNYAFDLLSHGKFEELDLLESHTGLLKHKSMWYTKYQDSKNLVRIPFTEYFLQIFGDGSTFFPFDKKRREDIVQLAEKYKWTCNTTSDRVKFCITNLSDPLFIAILRDMIS